MVFVRFPQYGADVTMPGGNPGHLRTAYWLTADAARRYTESRYPGIVEAR